ncbi:putative ABC transporter, ATP-binding protein [Treponema primitia ZAS-2]|uniref:Putative ABC transporter, ATP-binding protein n=1 Tax=Treponema primitia (strain ATCC BAA-887 / DSM 12427 / ZAS-2) TaxID=545694 RepID=F5YJA0_TREPZ|nr:ATP-binding cassette domain-containing protein [Treponema primitia]AEF84139.1 putative ABC transporter, ATP-binding protein [Treponema primitia ZAS-2]
MVEPIIEIKDVSFSSQNVEIVRNISLKIDEGKTLALVGPSGGGKSTVLKLAAGLLVPTGGKILFKGKSIAAMNRVQNLDFRREGAVVFQDSALWSNQNLYQCLELPLKVHFPKMSQADREKRIREVLNEVGYKKDTNIRPAMLSTGEQKLIAFARAMICKPELLFLDEWTESLDDTAAQRLITLVRRQQEEQRTIIFVSHDFRIIKSLADHIVMIIGGQLYLKLTRDQIAENENLSQMIEKGIAS